MIILTNFVHKNEIFCEILKTKNGLKPGIKHLKQIYYLHVCKLILIIKYFTTQTRNYYFLIEMIFLKYMPQWRDMIFSNYTFFMRNCFLSVLASPSCFKFRLTNMSFKYIFLLSRFIFAFLFFSASYIVNPYS